MKGAKMRANLMRARATRSVTKCGDGKSKARNAKPTKKLNNHSYLVSSPISEDSDSEVRSAILTTCVHIGHDAARHAPSCVRVAGESE